MEISRKLQRLLKPGGISHFGGGPGWKGGFVDEGLELFNDKCFTFDYMGAAEFEGGEVPCSLTKIMAKFKKYELFHVEDYGSQSDIQWRPKEEPWDVGPLPPVLAFAPSNMQDYVMALVMKMWSNPSDFKENPGLQLIVKYPEIEPDRAIKGWLDINADVLLFVDGKMCMKTIDVLSSPLSFSLVLPSLR